jgi:uncharacterized protein (DUF608 family)
MVTFSCQDEQASGIPLGGIGTGTVEIWPDGHFHDWQIFNLGQWAPRQPAGCVPIGPDMPPGALSFFVWTRRSGQTPVVRRLGLRADQNNPIMYSWLRNVQEIEFSGCYPVAHLEYRDDTLPIAVTATVFSPFMPHDARTSGTPGFYAVFSLRNCSAEPVQVSLLGLLRNPLAWGAQDRRLANSVRQEGDATLLTMRTAAEGRFQPALGSICLGVSGGQASWVAGEYRAYMAGENVGDWQAGLPYGQVFESLLHDYRASGCLPSLDGWQSPSALVRLNDAEIDALADREQAQLLQELQRYAFVHGLQQRVLTVDPDALATHAGRATFLKEVRYRLNVFAGQDRRGRDWGDGALCSALELAPAEEKEIVFALGWHFPNHWSESGQMLGHMYEHWFEDAEQVSRFLLARFEPHRRKTCAFAQTLHDTTLTPELPDAWAGQITTLAKCSWWTQNGDFGIWEGLGCCGFHTTDITYQGSFGLLALFPELQKRQMEMGARYQRADGRVHHFFTPDLSSVDNGFDRVDMNPQFVLLACRDYLWTGDREYLSRLWPHIVRAMDNAALLDGDGDGLPDRDTRRNTYDGWNFSGTPSYIASLWLAALRAAIRLAEDLGEEREAGQWRALHAIGVASFDGRLWNGEYYNLWATDDACDKCCMTDQIDGEWFAQTIGLGASLPHERVTAALRAIVKYNYSSEEGLINATYPPGEKPLFCTYRNSQSSVPWTGIEYAIGSMLLGSGMIAEGLAVVRNIHDRYLRAGRMWNQVECGDHYYRAMSSWALLLASTGFRIDVPRKTVTFAPVIRQAESRAPWVSSTGWGHFVQTPQHFELYCDGGSLSLQTLRLSLPEGTWRISCRGEQQPATFANESTGTIGQLRSELVMREGDRLVVSL